MPSWRVLARVLGVGWGVCAALVLTGSIGWPQVVGLLVNGGTAVWLITSANERSVWSTASLGLVVLAFALLGFVTSRTGITPAYRFYLAVAGLSVGLRWLAVRQGAVAPVRPSRAEVLAAYQTKQGDNER